MHFCPVLNQGFLGQSIKYDKKIHRYIEHANKNDKAQTQVNIIAQRKGFDKERDFWIFFILLLDFVYSDCVEVHKLLGIYLLVKLSNILDKKRHRSL